MTDWTPADRAVLCDALADLLSYPGEDFRGPIDRLRSSPAADPAAAGLVLEFGTETARLTRGEMEELYTRTFDLNPDASLETGWQLFGETYERGAYLVKARHMLRSCGVAESGELPDHLSYLLRAVGRLPEEEAAIVASGYLRKPVAKMIAAVADAENPYRKLLQAAAIVIDTVTTTREGVHQ